MIAVASGHFEEYRIALNFRGAQFSRISGNREIYAPRKIQILLTTFDL